MVARSLPRPVARCAPPCNGAWPAAFPARNRHVDVESPDDPLLPGVPAKLHDFKFNPLARRADAVPGNALLRTGAVHLFPGHPGGGFLPRATCRVGKGNGLPEAHIRHHAHRRRRRPGKPDHLNHTTATPNPETSPSLQYAPLRPLFWCFLII